MYYFAYGKNLNIERSSGWKYIGIGNLCGYKWLINERGVATLRNTNSSSDNTQGVIFEITEDDMRLLDRYEGYPRCYDRWQTDIELENRVVKAWVYFDSNVIPGKPRDGYIEAIVTGLEYYQLDPVWISTIQGHSILA